MEFCLLHNKKYQTCQKYFHLLLLLRRSKAFQEVKVVSLACPVGVHDAADMDIVSLGGNPFAEALR